MQKLFRILLIGLTFAVLNVATVAAQADIPTADNSAAPINEGRDMDVGSHRAAPIGDAEESGGPAAQHMNREINDGGFGANSGADAEKARADENRKKLRAIARCIEHSPHEGSLPSSSKMKIMGCQGDHWIRHIKDAEGNCAAGENACIE